MVQRTGLLVHVKPQSRRPPFGKETNMTKDVSMDVLRAILRSCFYTFGLLCSSHTSEDTVSDLGYNICSEVVHGISLLPFQCL